MADVPKRPAIRGSGGPEEMFIVPKEKLQETTTHFVSELEKGKSTLSVLS
jgi:hypothetical protein